MLCYELRDDLVLALELGLKRGDDPEVFRTGCRVLPLEGGGTVLYSSGFLGIVV